MPLLYNGTSSQRISDSSHVEDRPALAIVGLSFEFPEEATSSERFWEMIVEGRCASKEIPGDRMNIENYYHPDETRASTIAVRKGHFVKENIGAFDAPFFSINPGEASSMDPQHRRLLETAYHALEDAGIPIEKCTGSDTSVYTGCFTNDYSTILQDEIHEKEQRHAAVGIATTMLANRLSWFFDFKGTSMNVDSACSSSLVALHLACKDLLSGASSMSLVGGANLVFHPNFMKMMSSSSLLSPDGRCWSFDERGNGYARGEGMAVMVIKRVEDALQDGDTIRAVIRNTGSNQDGKTPAITQPSLESQVTLIERTYQQAGLSMEPTRFFEAHGTGTAIGDPTEANSIGHAFRHCRSKSDPIYVGAVKANVGHLEGASGMASVIKALLVLENGVIPPIAGLETLNPRINADQLGLHFPRKATPWPTGGLRRACVNSFGFGGTNATAILDDAYHYLSSRGLHGNTRTRVVPPSPDSVANTDHNLTTDPTDTDETDSEITPADARENVLRVLALSATGQLPCQTVASQYREYLEKNQREIDDVAYALAERRSLFPWRSFIIADSCGTIIHDECKLTIPVKAQSDARVAFIFTGQGAQYLGMGRELSCYPIFQKTLHALQSYLDSLGATWSLDHFLNSQESSLSIDEPQYSQPLTTCLQIALVDLMKSFGILPTIVVGHSSGEIAAAYTTGSLSIKSAVKIAYYRGLLSSNLASRKANLSMMAVGVSIDDAVSYLDDLKGRVGDLQVWVGCVNSPKSVTLTGDVGQLDILRKLFDEDSIFSRRLHVPMSYHSPVMDEVSLEYQKAMDRLEPGELVQQTPMISSVTRDVVDTKSLCQPDYWIKNMTSPVEFHGALAKVLAQAGKGKRPRKRLGQKGQHDLSITHIIEIGPHGALRGPIGEILRNDSDVEKPVYIQALDRKSRADQSLLVAIGKLHCAGFSVDLRAVNLIKKAPRRIPHSLPPYPFNHTQTYWNEGRLSKRLRFRAMARHDLLGTQILDWNPEVSQWRNTIRLNEAPWLRDHKVDGQIVFPGAGMVVMAIEAFRQIHPSGVTGILLKDVDFSRALTFGDNLTEIETSFLLYKTGSTSNESNWCHFRLFLIDSEVQVECCSGFIRGEFDQNNSAIDSSFTFSRGTQSWANEEATAHDVFEDPYSLIDKSVVQYGPSFRVLEYMQLGPQREAIAKISTDKWKIGQTSVHRNQQYTIHPCTLDGLAQVILIALFCQQNEILGMVPRRVSSIWIDCRSNALSSGKKLLSTGKSVNLGRRSATGSVIATTSNFEPVTIIDNLEASFIEGGRNKDQSEEKLRLLCTRVKWRPDIDLMSSDQILKEISQGRPKEPACTVPRHDDLALATLCFVEEAVKYLQQHPSVYIPEYLIRYTRWMKYQQSLYHNQKLQLEAKQLLDLPMARQELNAKVEASGIEGRLTVHVGRNLVSVLTGDADPLDLIFRDNLADLYYEEMLANEYHAYPASFLMDRLCFKNPCMRILEIGAGTGGQTLRTLETIASDGIKRCDRYVYTDISPAFFPRAKEKFQDYADILEFKVCDISKDPTFQLFEPATFDLVIASHVLHATNNIGESLQNIRTLLKPGGKLLLFETTQPDSLRGAFAFGLLKGWWSPLDHELRTTYSPCLPTAEWNERLQNSEFSGVDLDIPGQENEKSRFSSILVSTAVSLKDEKACPENKIFVVRDSSSSYQNQVANFIASRRSTSIFTLEEILKVDISTSTTVVFLIELQEIFLADISPANFDLLREVLIKTQNAIWITEHVGELKLPGLSLIEGILRSLASEDSSRRFITLALDGSETEEQLLGLVSRLSHSIQNNPVNSMETTYSSDKGILQIPRVCDNGFLDDQVSSMLKPYMQDERQLGPDVHASIHIGNLGALHTLEYLESPQPPTHNENQLLVNVQAVGLTGQDYVSVMGGIDRWTIGTECAGVVQKAGVNTPYQPGDRVCAIGQGLASTSVCVNADAVATIPPEMSFSEAASLPTSLWLAFYSLHKLANLEEGEWVLVHQATSCVGLILIQMAMKRGAHVLATVSSAARRELLCDKFDLSPGRVYLSDDVSMCRSIKAITQNSGIDVVVGSLANWNGPDLSACLAAYARVIDIGNISGGSTAWEPRQRAVNISRATVSLVELLQHNPALVYRTFKQAVKLWFEKADMKSPVLHLFAANDLETAFSQIRQRERIGKSVLEMKQGITIKVKTKNKSSYEFSGNSTYVISGGLGGLGRHCARWMVSRGARYLILLSRFGPKTAEAYKVIHELREQGATVAAPQVDVGDLSKLKQVLAELSGTMPPIRGCIQGTLVLRDNLFENMTYEDWKVSTSSKAEGSWNLHLAMPTDLDFFILLSSINGIFGGRGQANYAAGNSFQDALAHYRISQGQKAVTINLGLMGSEGVIAEDEFLLASVRQFGHLMEVRNEEFIALLDFYCNPQLPLLPRDEAQPVIGIELPTVIAAKGVDLHHTMRRPMFSHLFRMGLDSNSSVVNQGAAKGSIDRPAALKSASPEEAASMITEWIAHKVGHILGIPATAIERDSPLHAHGIDSLVAVDMKNWFMNEIGANFTVFDIMSNSPITQMSVMAAEKSRFRQ
ncbi:putative polyketide synthase [Aspergillus costaricaensis CBS 115574]|uniref:Polyketide synthase n=1 Tax=Aspergillus costaricaensis CBS 115574 TaxID=1448317 RepID=A0ACD1ISF6_9EURO|nr:putative polyketide synthase [Aspergillus costaricaensis CBS 115574]RAK93462.1 putative polyketide synthase [Aspergillus costaricaensis CBS 115574]